MILFLNEDFTALNAFIAEQSFSKLFILVDENTHEHCLPTLLSNLETDLSYEIIEIEAGEELKNIQTASHIWQILAEFEADRKALFINLGGGVVTDMGGFVASTYKRGIAFINLPTTLLAMCDASIGGKTGIDLDYLKNMVGTFALPERIMLYPEFLNTLGFKELRSGFAEMLKHGLIRDKAHWENLSNITELLPEAILPHIKTSMKIKQDVVEKDFKEQNIRKCLNFGHTIGHAVESLFLKSGKIVPHGECVAMGMICETKLAVLEGVLDETIGTEIISKIQYYFPKLDISHFSNEDIVACMHNDKKNSGKAINFVLLDAIGSSIFDYQCQMPHILSSLEFYKNL